MSGRPNPCMICGNQAEYFGSGDSIRVTCARCGQFIITRTALEMLRDNPHPQRAARLSGCIGDQNQLGEWPTIDSEMIRAWEDIPKPNVLMRANRLLDYLIENSEGLNSVVEFDKPSAVARTYSLDSGELQVLGDFLASEGFAKRLPTRTQILVTPKGHLRHDELIATRAKSVQAFVAMWFDPGLDQLYRDGLKKGIEGAGYEAVRVDNVEHTGKIDDEIVAQIRKSRFLVADYTGHRGGVYFEAGFAMGLGLPVIWTCRDSDLGGLHFDLRQFNFIAWKDAADLATRLQRRIEAVIGPGPVKRT